MSLWQKTQRKRQSIEPLVDFIGLSVLLEAIAVSYGFQAIAHSSIRGLDLVHLKNFLAMAIVASMSEAGPFIRWRRYEWAVDVLRVGDQPHQELPCL
jgi:hypothetical protein